MKRVTIFSSFHDFLLIFVPMKRLHLLLIISISTASFAQAPEKRVNDTEVANDSVSTVTLDRSAHELKGVTVMGRLPMRVNEWSLTIQRSSTDRESSRQKRARHAR